MVDEMTQQDDITQRVLTDAEIMRSAINASDSLNITRLHELGAPSRTIMDDAGLLELGRAVESALLSKLRAPVADEHCSASNPQVFSVEQLEKDPLLVARLWRKPAGTDGSLVERILEHFSEYGESMASSTLLSVRTIARRNLEARIEAELADAMRSQDESPLREALSEIASAWSARTRLPEEDGIQALKDIARAALASAPVADDAGYALVPVEPTKEMLAAAFDLFELSVPEHKTGNDARRAIYMAMVNAAPQASTPVGDERAAQEYGSPADVAQRIEQYLAQDGRMNSGTQLLYEAMKTLRGLAGESK